MKVIAVFIVACMLVSQQAAAEIYKCTDANGKIHYGDKPCEGESTIFTPKTGPKADENVVERRARTERLLRAYREEHAEAKQQAAELKAEEEQHAKNCQRAKNRHRQMTEAGRFYRIDKDGTYIDYTEEERTAAIAGEEAAIKKWCG